MSRRFAGWITGGRDTSLNNEGGGTQQLFNEGKPETINGVNLLTNNSPQTNAGYLHVAVAAEC